MLTNQGDVQDPVHLDGSEGEGGGQILRTALTLALILGRPFTLDNVRANRPKPGLKAQHLEGLLAAAKLGDATVEGDELHSRRVAFAPSRSAVPGDHTFEIKTAGSTSLLLQTVLLPLALGTHPSTLSLVGGTHVPFAPSMHYLDRHVRPVLESIGVRFALEIARPGFFPKGGGRVNVTIDAAGAAGIRPFALPAAGRTGDAEVTLHTLTAGSIPSHVPEREETRTRERLYELRQQHDGLGPLTVHHEEGAERPANPGNAVLIRCRWPAGDAGEAAPTAVAGFQALGARGKPAEAVADEAIAALEEFLAADAPTVDRHLADQLMLPAALAAAGTPAGATPIDARVTHYRSVRVTNHMRTNARTIMRFLPGVAIDIDEQTADVTVRPAG